jgi:hypothetical protein
MGRIEVQSQPRQKLIENAPISTNKVDVFAFVIPGMENETLARKRQGNSPC